jgi:hypothetical protein
VSGWGGMRWDEGEMGRSGGGHTVLRDVRCCAAANAPRRATSALAGGVDMGWDGMGRDGARGGARWQGGGEGHGGREVEGWGRDGGGMGEGWVRGRRWDGRRGSYVAHLQLTRRRCRRGWTPKRGALWVERGWTPLPCPKGMRNPGTRETHQLRHAVGGAAQMRCGQRRSYGWCRAADVECVQRRGNSR